MVILNDSTCPKSIYMGPIGDGMALMCKGLISTRDTFTYTSRAPS